MTLAGWLDKAATLGTLLTASGCAACFPVLASIGAVLGLGFLSQYEGTFLNSLLPAFAAVALFGQLWLGVTRRQWLRLLAGVAGPAMVLATLYLFWSYAWSTLLFYVGLGLMFQLALFDAALLLWRRNACAIPGEDRRTL